MRTIFWLFSLCSLCLKLVASTDMYYGKNYGVANNERDLLLIQHAAKSYYLALEHKGKLKKGAYSSNPGSICFLLNNLCSLERANHLHITLDQGMSLIFALHGNSASLANTVGIDVSYRMLMSDLLLKHGKELGLSSNTKILNTDAFEVDLSLIPKPIDIFFYDGHFSRLDLELAFVYFNPCFADTFIAVVDDWGWEQVRGGTFDAFDELEYEILFETVIYPGAEGNGLYLAVIRKKGAALT